jgi:pullulanase
MKTIALTTLFSLGLASAAPAQDFSFDEMTYSPRKTTFKLFAPPESNPQVLLLEQPGNAAATQPLPMTFDARKGIWQLDVEGDLLGRYYVFKTPWGQTPGVFAKAVGVNGQQAAIIDMAATNPDGWENDHRVGPKNPADWVIYEMHHRDFSVASQWTRHPGKFLALGELWATQYLEELGVNAVHMLPSYDYGSVDEARPDEPQYNWGYDPVNYNVPEGSYSTDPCKPEVRIREFKQMVQRLHQAGIAVILDVVYNHTFDIDHSNFQKTFPDYFYRKVGGQYSNGSGCGNETASEQPMMRRFMIESVKYWAQEYHIDGFRFDLMGCHDIETMNQIRRELSAIDPTIFIYGEGWSAGACALPQEQLAMKAHVSRMPGIAAFSDDLRDALRGPFSDDTKPGWLGMPAEDHVESIKAGIVGMIAHPQVDYSKVNYSKEPYAAEPTQMIAYVSCHDDMCLTDRLRASIPGITTEELIRLDLLAQTAVLTSQGVPFLLSGEELLRTKQGVHNSYKSPDSINQLDWTGVKRYPQVYNYYRRLIRLRQQHPAFRLGSAEKVRRHLEFLPTKTAEVVAFRLKDHAGGDRWQDIIVVLNASRLQQEVAIPKGRYVVVCADGKVADSVFDHYDVNPDRQPSLNLGTVKGRKVRVAPQSALILHN